MSPRPRPTGRRRRLAALGEISVTLALVAGAGLQAGTASAAPQSSERARYIVTTTSFAATSGMFSQMSSASTRTRRVFKRVFPGFAAELSSADVAKLRQNPDVTSIVPDARVHVAATTTTTPPPGAWGLDRIDQRSKTLNGTYSYDTDGDGVVAIVLDTGLNASNSDFRGRVLTGGYDYADGDEDPSDCNGHGTHVAGTLAGTKYGVAKKADILPLRILDCDGGGYTSDTIQALDDVAYSADGLKPAVVNLSLGGAPSRSVDTAVNAVIAAGIPVVVAAGNADPGRAPKSACTASPARVPNAITVGATDRSDKAASFSYYGPCVDVWAPGVDIESDWIGGAGATEFESGTSMAAPHVAGAVARFLSAHPTASPASVSSSLVASATSASVSTTAGSPNRLLYSRFYVPPSAARTVSASASSASLALTMKWTPPSSSGGSPVRSYEVRRSGTDAKGRTFTPVKVSATTRSYRFAGLKAATRYGMSVTPINSSVRGPAKAVRVSTVSKPGRGRVSTPSSGSTSDSATSITARWRPPSSGGKPSQYTVSYRRAGTGTYTAVKVGASKRSLKITKLRKNAKYVVIVRAANAAGLGKNSARSKSATAR